MRAYELMVIFDSSLDDLVVDEQVKSVAAQIATRGASAHSTDRWGRRRFSYARDQKTEAAYVVWEDTADGADLVLQEQSSRHTIDCACPLLVLPTVHVSLLRGQPGQSAATAPHAAQG